MQKELPKRNIVVIGGANLEYIIKSDTEIEYGGKNSVDIQELYGGSGVNYALRLLHTGERVYPILFAGADHAGMQIRHALSSALHADDPKIRYFIEEHAFFVPGVTTPRSTIIVEGSRRTILTQDRNNHNTFRAFVGSRVKNTEDVSALVIGHIHSDKPVSGQKEEDLSTLFAINYFRPKIPLIYANFGSSQIAHGFAFWQRHLSSIDILQLNIYEMKRLFREGEHYPSLHTIVQKLQALDISAIITLDKFGAIGILKGHNDTIFMARPVELGERFVDSTGAGDAFCAGMVSALNGREKIGIDDYKEAMAVARSWAVYACMSYGGANNCPSAETIETFHRQIVKENEVLLYRGERVKDIFALIDITMELHEA